MEPPIQTAQLSQSTGRTVNPFSAGAISGGRLPYLFSDARSRQDLEHNFQQHDFIAQLVGPHGSGKTTLAHELWRRYRDRFPTLVEVTIRGPKNIRRTIKHSGGRRMLLVDGIERLNWLNRRLLLSQFSNRVPGGRAGQGDGCPGDGLIVTSHRAVGGLPIIFQTSFDAALLDRIVKKLMQLNGDNDIDKALLAESPGWQWESISWESISCDLLARHGENGRAILMDLYDLYQSNSINQHPEKKPLSFARGKN